MNNLHRAILALIIIVAGVWLVTTATNVNNTENTEDTVSIVTSFYPLAFFSEQIGGNLVSVSNLVPAGSEPHDYRPTPQDIASIYEADLFIYNGGGIDAWASQTEEELSNTNIAIIEMAQHIDGLLDVPEGHSHDHGHDEDHDDEHGHDEQDDHDEESHDNEDEHHEETFDEHFWLDPNLAIIEVETIRNTLSAIDPDNTQTYFSNAADLIDQLTQLDQDFTDGLANCEIRTAVTSHAAFGYLAQAYNFDMIAIAGISPHEEPSAGTLAEIAHEAEELGVTHIYFETLVNPALANTLAEEIGAETLVFNPLGGLTQEQLDNGETYLTVMYQNLENLQTGMVCQPSM